MIVKDILEFLSEKFPLNTALDFDNVGLLVGSEEFQISGVVVALDCEIDTVKFAVRNGCNLIVTHHPVIFSGLKKVLAGDVVWELIKNEISVISMHTNVDFAEDGVTETLCKVIGLQNVELVLTSDGVQLRKGSVIPCTAQTLATKLKACLGECIRYTESNRLIENVIVCAGSGGSYLNETITNNCDALITADVKHNVFIDSINSNVSVFDAGHFATEDIIVKPLMNMLNNKFFNIKILPYHSSKIKSL